MPLATSEWLIGVLFNYWSLHRLKSGMWGSNIQAKHSLFHKSNIKEQMELNMIN